MGFNHLQILITEIHAGFSLKRYTDTVMKKHIFAILLCFMVLQSRAESFTFTPKGRPLTIYIDEGAPSVAQCALDMFCNDYQQLFGTTVQISDRPESDIVIKCVPDGAWEQFTLTVSNDGRLLVEGSDPRGTAYGILELSRLIGISPWIWWADVTPQKHGDYTLPAGYRNRQKPSVQYRGIFINDEDYGLNPWSWKTHEPESDKGEIGPRTYERIFQLLLRLRANMLMPAMHDCSVPFYMVESNKEMAEKYQIVMATSHCEPLMRNNVGEWDSKRRGGYNYISNRDSVLAYWAERLAEVGKDENIYTIGMRGIHDGKMEGCKNISEMARVMPQVIADQRNLLTQYVDSPASKVPQIFVPYKELLDVYNKGIDLPGDVTLMWCDDNYGHITRLSDQEEQRRKGGSGIYYHISYWGRPHSYLWLCTTAPAQIYYEMRRAWDYGARKIWALNVGDIKPAEYDMEFFMDMAWNIDAITPDNIYRHLHDFMCRTFSPQTAQELTGIMNEYYHLANIRRPEFMGWSREEEYGKIKGGKTPVIDTEFSPREITERIARYQELERQVKSIKKQIPSELKDAFFQLVEYPVSGAALMNYKWLYAQMARNATTLDDARRYETASINAYNAIAALDRHYNFDMNKGKWNGIISMKNNRLVFEKFELPDDFSPRDNLSPRPEKVNIIARDAADHNGKRPHGAYCVEGLGYSRRAIVLPKGKALSYRFDTQQEGDVAVWVSLLPTHPVNGGDLRYEISVDGDTPQVVSFKTVGRSEAWKINVLRNLSLQSTRHELHKKSFHTVQIKALDEGVVIDQLMLDFEPEIPFYRIPEPEISGGNPQKTTDKNN